MARPDTPIAAPERPGLWLDPTADWNRCGCCHLLYRFIGGISHWSAWHNLLLQYLAVYVPVRWFEWGVMELLVARNHRNPFNLFVIGGNGRSRLWRLGGIVVSHLADIPMILMGGGVHEMLPIGRFLC
jgi:hypothetical protein